MSDKTDLRDSKGRFKKGNNLGRQNGRKPGTTNKSKVFKEVVEPHAKEILEKLLEMARSGDSKAMERICGAFIPKDGQLAESCEKLELSGTIKERAWQLIMMYEDGKIDSPRVLALFKMYELYSGFEQHDIIVNKIDDLRNFIENST